MLKPADFKYPPCTCPSCFQAGVSERPQRRSPQTGVLLHGYDLLRLYAAEEKFWREFRVLVAQRPMPTIAGKPMTIEQRIDAIFAPREPGSDG